MIYGGDECIPRSGATDNNCTYFISKLFIRRYFNNYHKRTSLLARREFKQNVQFDVYVLCLIIFLNSMADYRIELYRSFRCKNGMKPTKFL